MPSIVASRQPGPQPVRRPAWPRRLIYLAPHLALLLIVALGGVSVFEDWQLTHPARTPATVAPDHVGLTYQSIGFRSRIDHLPLSGWWIPAQGSTRVVIILHGYATNRATVPILDVARVLHQAGIDVLLFDFRASGTSGGSVASFGQFEQRDALGAVDYVRQVQHCTRVGLIGYSMGAATALLVAADDPTIAGVVADSSFDTLHDWMAAGIPYWTHLPARPYTGLIMSLMPIVTGVDPESVSPLAAVPRLGRRPVLFVTGLADRTVPPDDSRRLYAAAAGNPNASLWLVPGANHIESYTVSGGAPYVTRVLALFHTAFSLRGGTIHLDSSTSSYGVWFPRYASR